MEGSGALKRLTEAQLEMVAGALMKAKFEVAGRSGGRWVDEDWAFCIVCGKATQNAWACDGLCWHKIAGNAGAHNKPTRFKLPPAIEKLVPLFYEERALCDLS